MKIKYDKEDLEKLFKLFKHIGPFYEEQQNFIWNMTKKYINKDAPRPVAGCNCPLGYGAAFNNLRDWTMKNSNLFV